MVTWIIGLAGAGKTTIGREVHRLLQLEKPNVLFLDGDHVRHIMGNDLGHDLEDRRQNAWRICRMCQYLDNQGIDVVCSILSIFREHQDWNRTAFQQYLEVFVEVPMSELRQRDQKGLYSDAEAGRIKDVAGVDLPFTPPNADLVLSNGSPLRPPTELAQIVVDKIKEDFDDPNSIPIRRAESA